MSLLPENDLGGVPPRRPQRPFVGLTRNGPWPRRVGLEGQAELGIGANLTPHPDMLETPIAPEPHPQQ